MTHERYLRAIFKLAEAKDDATRCWAKQAIRDMTEPGVRVHDYLEPLMKLPRERLDHIELRVRNLAAQIGA